MKKTFLIIALLYWGLNIYAQENDTTKIKLGDTKVIIIEKKGKSDKTKKEKLEKGREEFEKLLEEKTAEIERQQALIEEKNKMIEEQQEMLEQQQDEALKNEAEKLKQDLELQKKDNEDKIKELEKEVKALEKGIEGIDSELDDEVDWDNDHDWSHKEKFDWDFDNEWPSDWDNLSPFGKKKKFRGHWAGFELGLNNYVDKDYNITLPGNDANFELNAGGSWVFTINFAEYTIPFGKNAGLVTGFGTDFNNYHFRNNVNVYKNVDGIMVAENEPIKSYNKNTINTWSFTMPLILEFQLHKPGFYLGAGVVGSAKVLSWGKQHYTLDGVKYEEKRRSDFLMNTFSYGLTVRAGFKFLKVFANYDLVPLFQEDRGPEIYPVSVGLTLISF